MNRARRRLVKTLDVNVKPCPFCGGDAKVVYAKMYHVQCPKCGLDAMWFGAETDKYTLVSKWEARA